MNVLLYIVMFYSEKEVSDAGIKDMLKKIYQPIYLSNKML